MCKRVGLWRVNDSFWLPICSYSSLSAAQNEFFTAMSSHKSKLAAPLSYVVASSPPLLVNRIEIRFTKNKTMSFLFLVCSVRCFCGRNHVEGVDEYFSFSSSLFVRSVCPHGLLAHAPFLEFLISSQTRLLESLNRVRNKYGVNSIDGWRDRYDSVLHRDTSLGFPNEKQNTLYKSSSRIWNFLSSSSFVSLSDIVSLEKEADGDDITM